MSEIRTNLMSDATGAGPTRLHKQSAAKAWAYIEFVGATPTVSNSVGISSVEDVSIGTTRHNLISAMTGAYAAQVTAEIGSRVGSISTAKNSTNYTIRTNLSNTAAEVDVNAGSVTHGDLA
jgi:hypothetical protein